MTWQIVDHDPELVYVPSTAAMMPLQRSMPVKLSLYVTIDTAVPVAVVRPDLGVVETGARHR